ncbi:uncharacterized protein MYCFIDRAFT_211884 [Pseudocercospora fijiensis CIRAD86]|uniref:Uncharacterized protein n=1 Tax=Pseudocercospora fijiensis (strain CIRAD86) TaxID=383855 RepID=M3A5G7_PSEFD|nr:uncharacterized protein MYCFIDRAFT_211884 [Pseudocercospora fijiensis CIRAD86]EME79851.1 hypothetical protein MYCFIDRAFT_211884 [Pseudocercospora fijiensis CIRAD86]
MKSLILAITALWSVVSVVEGMNGFLVRSIDAGVAATYNKFKIRGVNQHDEAPWAFGGPPGAPGPPKGAPGPPKGAPGPTKGSPSSPKGAPGGGGGCNNAGYTCGAGETLGCKGSTPWCYVKDPVAVCKAQGGAYQYTYTDPKGNFCCNHCDGTPTCPSELQQAQKEKHPCG